MKLHIIFLSACATALMSLPSGVGAATFNVSDVAGFQQALIDATNNAEDDTVNVAAGTYDVSGATLEYTPGDTGFGDDNHALTIQGAGAGATVLDGNNTSQVLRINTSDLASDSNTHITIRDLTFRNGYLTGAGAGLYCSVGNPDITVEDSRFSHNTTGQGGGAMVWSTNGIITFANNVFSDNIAYGEGGGAYAWSNDTVTFTNNTFDGNSADEGGGAYASSTGTIKFTNNIFDGNSSDEGGGAYAFSNVGVITFTNNTFNGNDAPLRGGGLYIRLYLNSATANLYNNILWGNTAGFHGNDLYVNDDGNGDDIGAPVNLFFNDVNDVDTVEGDHLSEEDNINQNPLLSADFHLQSSSPCINKGTDSAPELPGTDFEGDARIMSIAPDIGADEYTTAVWYVDGDRPASGDGTTWGTAKKTIAEAIGAASDGDEIWVRRGTYNPTAPISVGKAVAILGGFAGGETMRRQRNCNRNQTTVDGYDTWRCFYIAADAFIDGFAIVNGHDNSAGGGVYSYECAPTIGNCIFSYNSAPAGAGVFMLRSSATITNCKFLANSAGGDGGGIYNDDGSNSVITNCFLVDNTAGDDGGGMHNDESAPTITNCTFSGNSAVWYGGAVFNSNGSSAVITNCVLWGDTASSSDEIHNFGSSPAVTYCDVQGGYSGAGNIDVDPLFANAGAGNYRLKPNSACIDAGLNTAPRIPDRDFEADERIIDGDHDGTATVDMGADEYRAQATTPPLLPLLLD